jgi:hypothetical protein
VSECSLAILCIKKERKILYNKIRDRQLLSNFFLIVTEQCCARKHRLLAKSLKAKESRRDRGLIAYIEN